MKKLQHTTQTFSHPSLSTNKLNHPFLLHAPSAVLFFDSGDRQKKRHLLRELRRRVACESDNNIES
jgi:hypothetical protein